MYEMSLGSPIIRPGYDAAKTLARLHAFFGPLPNHLARHARSVTDVPFADVSVSPIPPFASIKRPALDLQKMGVSRKEVADIRLAQRFKDFKLCKEKGGPEFVHLVTKMLDYDPKKRISAGVALKHPYFSVILPQPITPGMQPIGVPRRA